MVDHGKRKKFHDKDKYYRLAKEQGLRSRAAFKLSQINRKFPILEHCSHGVLDLCAAPGGWTQIASRTCKKGIPIVAVDILPIRHLPSVTTIVGDITTDKCKSDIRHAISQVDVVLHDGAPNVGAEYGKDAYEQNEIAVHALRCATQHLIPGGTFITKLYRSRDYASYHWVLQQLFESVAAFKPKASRSQSAEIFLIAQHYKAPSKLDPRLLDPKHIFDSVEGETTGGSMTSTSLSVFHKNREKSTRQRGGYDMEHLDATMRHIESASLFVKSGLHEAIQILSQSTGLALDCEECRKDESTTLCSCNFWRHHALTTPEIKECLSDLQVLNKSDFKELLNWRHQMQEAWKAAQERDKEGAALSDASQSESDDSEKEEEGIQQEIQEMRQRRMRERKRQKKKERVAAAKRRRRAALGMDLNAIDVPEHEKLFSLATITSKGDLAAAAEVNLDHVTDEQLFGDSDDDVVIGQDVDEDSDDDDAQDEEAKRLLRREKELDRAYETYLENTKDGLAKSGTKMQKRSKKLQRLKVVEEAAEDQEMAMVEPENIGYDTKTYAKMLQGARDSDEEENESSSEDEDDDGFHAEPMTPEEHAQVKKAKKRKTESNPLIHKFADEPSSVKTARWFSNPLFESIGKTVQSAAAADKEMQSDDDSSSDESGSDSKVKAAAGKQKKGKKKIAGLDAEEIIASMPKTDKQKRHEKRLKQMERDERKKARLAKRLGVSKAEFEIAPANAESSEDDGDDKLNNLSESQRKKVLEARELIKAGMGKATDEALDERVGIEVVSEAETNARGKRPLPIVDDRKYDSEHEDYDSDDYAQTLALGTMMLRKSKEKALVDASYNRYAWNDPTDLPEWFVDEENKHYRPQLPIPPALIAKMKEKMLALSTKPIAKVAEARARKNKRAKLKLAAAKKQAEAVANSSEMSEAMKLKAISKALRGQEAKKPGKTYVVAKKGRGIKGAKGVKVVDKRLKADKRAMERKEKRRKKGKQNGLVGSKKRRHHG